MEKSHEQLDPSLKRKRGVVACVNCRARKVRCNVEGGIPCHNCITDKISCSIVQRKRRYPRPDWGSDTYSHGVKQDMACVSTPSSTYSTAFQYHAQSPEDHGNLARSTNTTAVPQSPSPESDSAHSDQAIAMWLLSCPVFLTSGLPDHLLGTITRASLSEQTQTRGQSTRRRAFQDCLRHIENTMEYQPLTPVTMPSSSLGNAFRRPFNDDADHNRAACNWSEDVQNLLKTCKDLIAVSCRLSTTTFTSTTNINNQMNAETSGQFSQGDDVGVYLNDSLHEISPTSWDGIDYTLPDELGANGFDCLLGMLDFEEATSNQESKEDT